MDSEKSPRETSGSSFRGIRKPGIWAERVLRGSLTFAPAAVATLVTGWMLTSWIAGLARFEEAHSRRDLMEEQLNERKAERAQLKEAVRRLEEDPNALELLAKSAHFLSAPDEIVVLLSEDPEDPDH